MYYFLVRYYTYLATLYCFGNSKFVDICCIFSNTWRMRKYGFFVRPNEILVFNKSWLCVTLWIDHYTIKGRGKRRWFKSFFCRWAHYFVPILADKNAMVVHIELKEVVPKFIIRNITFLRAKQNFWEDKSLWNQDEAKKQF